MDSDFEKGKMLKATGQEKTMDWEARKNKQGCMCEQTKQKKTSHKIKTRTKLH